MQMPSLGCKTKQAEGETNTIPQGHQIDDESWENQVQRSTDIFRRLFPNTTMAVLAYYIKRKLYYAPKYENCKNKQKPCRFFVVHEGGPSLLVIWDVEMLELLSVNCNTIQPSYKQVGQQAHHAR